MEQEKNSTEKQELSELEYLQKIEEAIFDLQSDNIQEIALTIMKYYQPNIQISFNHIICYLTYSYFIANSKNDDICIRFLQAIESQERSIKENQSNILKIFAQILLDSCSDESNYLLEKLLENKIIDEKFVIGKQTYYFGHLRTIEENQKIQQDSKFTGSFLSKFDEYSKENFETHKRLISEGVNPNELSKVLRNDDIEALQGITSQQDFNYDQLIESSMYERCSYVNEIYGPKRKTLVNFAAYFGSINCFKYLLMNNAKVSDTGNYAVAGGNHEIIHLCEQNHSSFDNALIVAIEFHRNDVFKYFYENKTKFRPNTKDLIDECLLNDNYEILGFLLDEGYILVNDVCINIMAKKGNLFIIKYLKIFPKGILASTYMNNMELVNYLLNENSVDINSETQYGDTAFSIAAQKGYDNIIELLLNHKNFDYSAKNHHGYTPLFFACAYNKIKAVQFLIDKHININEISDKCETVIDVPCKKGYFDIVKLLVQHGIDLSARDEYEDSALFHAYYNNHIEIVKYIIEHGVDVNFQDCFGCTLLMLASLNNQIELVQFLLEQKKIDVNAKIEEGWTSLMWASQKGHLEVVKLLLQQKGININAVHINGNTSLIYAVYNNDMEVVKLLLKQKGINYNAVNNDGNSALMVACARGYANIVKLLLKCKKININIKNEEGQTAYQIANKIGYKEIAKMVKRK